MAVRAGELAGAPGPAGSSSGQDSDRDFIPDAEIVEESTANTGAVIMGRGMFGGGEGPWDESWKGWWGDEPSFGVPVFVLTHHARAPLAMKGGTTFTFVTDGIESALEQARKVVAGDKNILVAGGANVVQQYLRAGPAERARGPCGPDAAGWRRPAVRPPRRRSHKAGDRASRRVTARHPP